MTELREARRFEMVEGGRDAWLRRVGLFGTNAEMAEALRVLKQRAELKEVVSEAVSVRA